MSTVGSDLDLPYTGLPADVIPLQYHVPMLLDEPRMTGFRQAIAAVVRPGHRVLELGAGTGAMSFFAARQGAQVVAVERDPVVLSAARSALAAQVGDAVTLVHADVREYLPDEPVDVVICEMMHVGLLRERQIEVIDGFKRRYLERFSGPLPIFLPAACVQAVQPVQQDFAFHGYAVPVPLFQNPVECQDRTVPLAAPQVFQQFFYDDPLPTSCGADLEFVVEDQGRLDAVRMITKNLLVARPTPRGSIEWLMNYLVVPLPRPLEVACGDRVRLRFRYRPGAEITALAASVDVRLVAASGAAAGTVSSTGPAVSAVTASQRSAAWSLASLEALSSPGTGGTAVTGVATAEAAPTGDQAA